VERIHEGIRGIWLSLLVTMLPFMGCYWHNDVKCWMVKRDRGLEVGGVNDKNFQLVQDATWTRD